MKTPLEVVDFFTRATDNLPMSRYGHQMLASILNEARQQVEKQMLDAAKQEPRQVENFDHG